MTAGESRSAKGLRRAATASLLALLLASCTSTSDPVLELRAAAEQEVAADAAADSKTAKLSLAAEEEKAASEAVAKADESAPASTADDKGAADQAKDEPKSAADDDTTADASTPEDAAATEKTEQAIEAKRRGFLSAFFSPAKTQSAAAAIALKKQAEPAEKASALEDDEAKPLVDTEKSAKPLVKLASAESGDPEPMSAALTSMDALPGVRTGDQLFEITRKSGDGDTSDVDVYENTGGSYRVASAAGFARMGAHGLIRQRPDVDVGCLKPGLVNILHTIERHYGKKILVTSGYRSPAHNRAVNGAKHSQHMYCAAADIQVPGVGKWELASYFRTMPGRGGVGTYCHTESVHIDVGPERDWNWRCRRRGK